MSLDEELGQLEEHDAVVDVLTDAAPPGSHDHERRHPDMTDEEEALRDAGAIAVLRRGLAVTPELRQGLVLTAVLAVATALGKLAVPILIQQILDRGVLGDAGYRPGFVAATCGFAGALIIGLYFASRATFLRLVRAAEASLLGLRVRTFQHIHRLSLADHVDQRRGALVSRVTSDVETMAQFTEWGAVAWIVDSVLLVTTIAVMLLYSWQLALVTVVVFLPLLPALRFLQRRQLAAYDEVRTAVGGTLSEVSELVTGAPVVHAYGLQRRTRGRLDHAIRTQYKAQMSAAKWFAVMFPLADLFGALTLATVTAVGAINGPAWGLGLGELIAFVFLVNLLLIPISELSEILDQTQTAIAGWRKILGVLATPIDVEEPEDGALLPAGALAVDLDAVRFAYRSGDEVLRGIDLHLPAGTNVAVVGETGSGKTTFAKLLCRLADPTAGSASAASTCARSTPRRAGGPCGWCRRTGSCSTPRWPRTSASGASTPTTTSCGPPSLPSGSPAGSTSCPAASNARSASGAATSPWANGSWWPWPAPSSATPGLLILDEATSSVDPETEQALAEALDRLAGRPHRREHRPPPVHRRAGRPRAGGRRG